MKLRAVVADSLVSVSRSLLTVMHPSFFAEQMARLSARTSSNAVCILAICGITVGLLFIRVIILRVLEMVTTNRLSSESVIGGIIVALIGAGLAFWGAKINEKSSSEFG